MYPALSTSLPVAQMFPGVQQETPTEETLHRLSLMTNENSNSPWHLNSLTGSPCMCRRSPRLLTNGYYDLSEESFMDEEGNLTLTPSKINISYKENLVRIFRRKKKVRRSFASLFSIDSSSSWLNSSLFSGTECPLAESSWIDGGSDFDSSFSNNQDFMTVKNFFFHLIILVLSICVAVFARWFLGGVVAALLMTMLVFAAVLHTAKSAYPCFIKSHNILDHVQSERKSEQNKTENLKNNYI
ncbi:hypothetical protein chiPu_0017845 [Chiloscyllium punctatum]|uniref:Transmembrane protein 71 n=1 Tax=Chiloscyllium punctatum TaxID=137246 RepID=A0A401RJ92_CHIPU|nr:hypothetical protein [Chiloscyllium punctatum]